MESISMKEVHGHLQWSHLRILKSVLPVNKSPPGKGSIERIPGRRGGGSFSSSTRYFGLTLRLSDLDIALLEGLANADGTSEVSGSPS